MNDKNNWNNCKAWALAAMLGLGSAGALAQVNVHVDLGLPGVQAAPVYAPPPPVHVLPRPVYVAPPVAVVPQPGYAPHWHGSKEWHKWHKREMKEQRKAQKRAHKRWHRDWDDD